MSLYWSCPRCKTTKSSDGAGGRNWVYRCDECGDYSCKSCGQGGDGTKHCEQDDCDGDGYSYTSEGFLRCIGVVSTEAEWEEQEKNELRKIERQKERERAYAERLKVLTFPFCARIAGGIEYVGDIIHSNVHINGRLLSVGDFEKVAMIDLSRPCQCRSECSVKHGRGYMKFKNGEKINLFSWWEKKHIFARRSRCVNFEGDIVMRLSKNCLKITIDVGVLVLLSVHTPSIDEVMGLD